jgi:hypothetical protein
MHTAASLALLPTLERVAFFSAPPVIKTVRDYINAVLTTENLPEHLRNVVGAPAWTFRWIHAVLGVGSEQQEVLDATEPVNLVEELGDRFWYSALCSDALLEAAGLPGNTWLYVCPFELALNHEMSAGDRTFWTMTRADASLDDLSKRLLVYTKKPALQVLAASAFGSVLATRIIADANGLDYIMIMQANINKLYARQLDAIKKSQQIGDMNRDLTTERSVLEKSVAEATKN